VASLVCITSGLLAEINIRVLHRVGGKRNYRVIDEVGTPEAAGGAPGVR
jgi:hypothetical protein